MQPIQVPGLQFPPNVYADIRIEQTTSATLTLRDGRVENVSDVSKLGAFLRVKRDGRWYYAATTNLDEVSDLFQQLAEGGLPAAEQAAPGLETYPVHQAIVLRDFDDPRRCDRVPLAEKLRMARARVDIVDRPSISTWASQYTDTYTILRFISSTGADVTQDRQRVGVGMSFTVAENGETFTETWSHSALHFDGLNEDPASLIALVERCEFFVRNAQAVEAGEYPVILSPVVTGVFAHESFGHKSEADFMLGDPAMAAEWELGKQVGSDLVSIVDHGGLDGPGYVPYDDEGQPSQETWLIRDGKLAGRLHSAETAGAFDESLTGNARAMSFEYEPIVRMTTTFVKGGNSTTEELFAGVEDGFFIETFKHGSGMSTFTIAPRLAWKIRDGKIAEPVRISVITGSVFETLGLIDGVSKDVEIDNTIFGGCGKFEQWPLPVAFGGPHIRISKMNVA